MAKIIANTNNNEKIGGKKMVTLIKCIMNKDKASDMFYLIVDNKKYYLFSQNHRKGVYNYYKGGVILDAAVDFSRSRRDSAILRTMQKLPMQIKYIESYYGIKVLRKSLGIKRVIKEAA